MNLTRFSRGLICHLIGLTCVDLPMNPSRAWLNQRIGKKKIQETDSRMESLQANMKLELCGLRRGSVSNAVA